MKRLVLLWAILAPAPFRAADAQNALVVEAGDRVKITAPACELRDRIGTFLTVDNDLFRVAFDDGEIMCPVGALAALEVWRGEKNWWKWILIGTGVGAGVGAAFGLAVYPKEGCDFLPTACDAEAALIFSAFTFAGLMSGVAIGLTQREKVWRMGSLPGFRAQLTSYAHGAIRFAFSMPLRR